ncbi:MAG: ABC transporter permease [Bacteroidetes bacterium]|nr:MAG: ABC transporter permease [Bacteroidota bacterium]
MIAFKLAYKNLVGAGLRTLLIVVVLSVAYFLIIFMNGLYQGWNREARFEMIAWEVGQGQWWQENYDPYDPVALTDAHATLPAELVQPALAGNVAPVLLTQATLYPEGRMMGIMLKGIDTLQQVIRIPTGQLKAPGDEIPALIGGRMAESTRLSVGDRVVVRWRDIHGTFDATEILIAGIFSTSVPAIDMGQVWIPLDRLQEMTGMAGEATLVVRGNDVSVQEEIAGWEFQGHDELFAELEEMIRSKSMGGSLFYLMMLALALLAVFDTQVLSIFRRQREIGTYISMGMTRRQVVGLFTVEGAMHAVLALAVGAIYGIPLLLYVGSRGIGMPEGTDSFGMAAAQRIMPYYSATLISGSVLLVMIATTIVSYLPSRKIAKMNPNDAIRGRIQ